MRPILRKPYVALQKKYLSIPKRIEDLEKNQINLFLLRHQKLLGKIPQKEQFKINEYKIFSQHREDGILLYIFSNIEVKSKTFVEIGIDDGRECNTANLSLNFGWKGMLVEKVKENVESARVFYKAKLGSESSRVKIIQKTVTAENINEVLTNNSFKVEVDLLSIDIDGNDYWIWKAIKVIKPRVVVIEYNGVFGPKRSITISYEPDFFRFDKHPGGFYYGASLRALYKLARKKGYRLVCCDLSGTNAFFIRRDQLRGKFKGQSLQNVYYQSYYGPKKTPSSSFFYKIKDYPYEKV